MGQEDYIALLYKTPVPTGPELGKALDAWADWCKDFDAREKEAASKPKSEYEL